MYLLVLNVIFHPKKRNFKTFFFLQTAKMTVTVHWWFLLSRGKAEESSQIVSPNLVTWCGGFLQRAHAPRDTRSTKKVCCEEIESALNTSLSQQSWQETEFISCARFPKFLFVYFVFPLQLWEGHLNEQYSKWPLWCLYSTSTHGPCFHQCVTFDLIR